MNHPFNPADFLPVWSLVLLGFLTAFIITIFAIPTIVTIAQLKNLHSSPNSRTSHFSEIPNLGGIAVFAGLVLATVIFAGSYFMYELKYIFAALVIIFFVGMKDDILVIAPFKKLMGQLFAIGLIAVMADIRISDFYGLFHIHQLPYIVSILLTSFVFIVIINGFNLIDGIDGLASGAGIITASVFGFWFWKTGNPGYVILSFSFVGTLAAFFYFNVFGGRNKIFMGDTGALIIGFVISILACRFLQLGLNENGTVLVDSAPAVVFGILILPLFDSLRVFILRIKEGQSPFHADRQHLHHLLLGAGCTHLQATLILLSVNMVFIALSFTLSKIGIIWLMVVILGLASFLSRVLVIAAINKNRERAESLIGTFLKIKTHDNNKEAEYEDVEINDPVRIRTSATKEKSKVMSY